MRITQNSFKWIVIYYKCYMLRKTINLYAHIIFTDQEPKLLYYLAAVGAKRCLSGMQGCTEGCKYDKTYQGIPPEKVCSKKYIFTQ